jgi:hypothetical protein
VKKCVINILITSSMTMDSFSICCLQDLKNLIILGLKDF